MTETTIKKIQTQRAFLRPFLLSDLTELEVMMTDASVMKFTGFKEPQTIARIKELLEKWTKDETVYCARTIESNEFIGWFMLRPTIAPYPELGFMLTPNKMGQGFATEIGAQLVKHAFDTLGAEKVMASTNPQNRASINVLSKLKMSPTDEFSSSENGNKYFVIQTS